MSPPSGAEASATSASVLLVAAVASACWYQHCRRMARLARPGDPPETARKSVNGDHHRKRKSEKAEYAEMQCTEEMLEAARCDLPPSLRVERRLRYDTARYPFAQLVAELLHGGSVSSSEAAATPLHRLHTTPECREWLAGVLSNEARAYAMRRNAVDKRFKQANGFRAGGALTECYERFVREVVAPLVEESMPPSPHDDDEEGCPSSPATAAGVGGGGGSSDSRGGGGGTLLYQREPNFRCHLPGTEHLLVHKHRDADYYHQPNELNVWIPLTDCFGSNTLWAESAPDKGDFRPFELRVGEMMLFWGSQCLHYTVPNETDATRVSIDFRVIPSRRLYRSRYPRSHTREGRMRFEAGAYYASL